MYFEFNRFSGILFVFFLHGLVYAGLLFRKAALNDTRSDRWLGIFLLLCVLYITPWMVGFGGWYDSQPFRDILFYIPFQHLLLIGPVIFFYVQSLLNPSFRFGKKEWLHLVPGFLYVLFSAVMVITDKLVLHHYYFLANGEDPDFDSWYQWIGFISMAIYFLLSLRYYLLYKKMIVQVISYADLVSFRWVRHFLLAFLAMLLLRLLFFICSFIPAFEALNYIGPWWQYLFFALLYYYIAIAGYANSVETRVPFRLHLLENKQPVLLEWSPGEPQQSDEALFTEIEIVNETPAETSITEEWKQQLNAAMQQAKLYEDPELSLTQLAKYLQTNPGFVSMLINKGMGANFNDYVNSFRIEAVKTAIRNDAARTQTLLGIAFSCGFNSKATFNRAFRKATGMSPREWLQQERHT